MGSVFGMMESIAHFPGNLITFNNLIRYICYVKMFVFHPITSKCSHFDG